MMQQTIPQNDAYIASHIGSTPSTGPFAVDFPFFSVDDVMVTAQTDGSALIRTLVRGADYTLAGVATDDGSFSSGTVTLLLAASLTTIVRTRRTPIERLSNFPLQGFFSRLALNAELNKITVYLQESQSILGHIEDNALRTPDQEFGLVVTADTIANRGGKVLAWDDLGNLIHSTAFLTDIEAGGGGSGSGSPASVTISTTPPTVSAPGNLWFFNDGGPGGGQLYIRYQDANATKWVPVAPFVGS
jgi:hypothetical protein